MANIRRLKKDIDFVTDEIIVECFVYNFIFPEKNEKDLSEIIADSMKLKDDLKNQINKVSISAENPAKKQFKVIREQLQNSVEDLVGRIENLDKY